MNRQMPRTLDSGSAILDNMCMLTLCTLHKDETMDDHIARNSQPTERIEAGGPKLLRSNGLVAQQKADRNGPKVGKGGGGGKGNGDNKKG